MPLSEPFLYHLTLNTGHLRRSPRHEVGEAVIRALAPMVAEAVAHPGAPVPMPGEFSMPGVTITLDQGAAACALVTLARDGKRLASIGIAGRSRCAAAVWSALVDRYDGAPPAAMPQSAPWVSVVLHAQALLEADGPGWIGDFERCLAWAWLGTKKGVDVSAEDR